MRVQFREEFDLPATEVFSYFETPAEWARLYGLAGTVRDYGDGWFAVPLARFPFPLIAKITRQEQDKYAHWIFRGVWEGEGDSAYGGARLDRQSWGNAAARRPASDGRHTRKKARPWPRLLPTDPEIRSSEVSSWFPS